jgi:hypothetical protein
VSGVASSAWFAVQPGSSRTRTSKKRSFYKVRAGLKAVYTATGEEAGRSALDEFGKTRETKYPMVRIFNPYEAWDTRWPNGGQ